MKFLLGLGLGFSLALLFAPAEGSQTRRRIAKQARDLASTSEEKLSTAADRLSETAREKAGEIGSSVGRQAAESVVESMLGTPKTA